MSKKKKVRVDLRKNRAKPPRENEWTRGFQQHGFADEATAGDERVRAKGDLSRRRTVMVDGIDAADAAPMPAADAGTMEPGRVVAVMGLLSDVEAADGSVVRCAVRRLLKTLATDARSVVTTGDRVWFRRTGVEGFIERVEPRRGVLTRLSRRKEHVLVSNVDQLAIIVSLVEPDLKPHLIDRYLATAQAGDLQPLVILNKADRVDPVEFQPLVGAYSQLGVPTLLTSAATGQGVDRLRERLRDRATVFSGQSGVGKSSLLNALQPGLALRVRTVSEANSKGRHTTTTAQLIKLDGGGYVVDTPGVRQLALWNVRAEEVEGFFREFAPFVALCGFPDCTHTHEERCAVKRAVDRGLLSERRYVSYLGMFNGSQEGV